MPLNRRQFLATPVAAMAAAQTAPRPNVLFLFADDMRFDTIHALGNNEIQTPNLDKLAARSLAFTHAHIMGGTQGAVCVPSRAMLMTGQTLFHVSASITAPKENWGKARPFILFPEVLGKNGYTTFQTGKWHNGPKLFARAFQSGANTFFGGMDDHTKTKVFDFDPSGQYPASKQRIAEGHSTDVFAASVIKFLNTYKDPKPFLVYAAFTAPHDPRTPPKQYEEMYPAEKITLPPNFLPEHPFDNGEMKIRDEALAPWPRTPEIVKREIALYYAMITHLDAQIGRILAALEESGRAANTIIIFAGDNGLAVGQHGLLGKQNMYEHSVRVPLMISGPGLPKGKRSDALVYLLDLAATIFDLTGIPVPPEVEGPSLAPILRGRKKAVRDSIFYAYRSIQRGVRKDDWKLIRYNANGKRTTQLFNLKDDPWEMKNLADDPRHGKRRTIMENLLADWMKKVDDPFAATFG